MAKKTDVKTPPEAEPVDLTEAIRKCSEGFEKLLKSGINRKGIVTLLAASTKVPLKHINLVLDGLGTLAKDYCTPKAKKTDGRRP